MTVTFRRSRRPRHRASQLALAAGVALGLLMAGTPGIAAPTPTRASAHLERPRGNPKAYNFIAKIAGEPVHWNPCERQGWRINVHRSPKRAVAQAKEAVARIKRATGLRFRFRGRTHVSPKQLAKYPRGTDLVLGWGRPKATGGAAGLGGPQWLSTGQIITGYVLLNFKVSLHPGFGRGPRYGTQGTEGQLMMHELGHAVGLQHVKDDAQIMYPTLTRKRATWGAGDRHGLRKVGKSAGCFPAVPGDGSAPAVHRTNRPLP